jgi:hypothetical protein
MRAVVLFFLLLLSPITFAATLEITPSVIAEGVSGQVATATANPTNRVFSLPDLTLNLEGRMEVKANASILDLTLRPRGAYLRERVNGVAQNNEDLYFQEAFLRANLADWLNVSAGRIQFGWGPAESISPTNWFAPEVQWQPSPYFEQLGVYRGQWNFSVAQAFSFVIMHELSTPGDHWSNRTLEAETYRRRWLGKAEWNWDNTNKVVGLVGGQERDQQGNTVRAGVYGNWTLSDAWQLYLDAVNRQLAESGHDWCTLGVMGVRYTFPGGAEIRAEGIHNGSGASRGANDTRRALYLHCPIPRSPHSTRKMNPPC